MLRRQFAAVLISTACVSTLSARDSKLLTEKIERLDTSKTSFESIFTAQTSKLKSRFDELIGTVTNSPNLSDGERTEIVSDLGKAREEFLRDGMFAAIPALQPHYFEFVLSIFGNYYKLMQDYQRVLAALEKDDLRRNQYSQEISTTADRVAKFDSLKQDAVFVGYREDINWGPVKGFVESEDAIRLKRIRNAPVNASIKLEVTERTGTYIAAKLVQKKGAFVATVDGTYDGVNLRLKVADIAKGDRRYFEYAGQVVGNIGQLQMGGIKTNGVGTTGMLTLQRTKEARRSRDKKK